MRETIRGTDAEIGEIDTYRRQNGNGRVSAERYRSDDEPREGGTVDVTVGSYG